MALVSCPDCRTEVSTTAKACPKCGARLPQPAVWPWILGVPVALFALFIGYGLSIPQYEADARAQRNLCEKIAATYQLYECDRIYAEKIAEGRRRAQEARESGRPVGAPPPLPADFDPLKIGVNIDDAKLKLGQDFGTCGNNEREGGLSCEVTHIRFAGAPASEAYLDFRFGSLERVRLILPLPAFDAAHDEVKKRYGLDYKQPGNGATFNLADGGKAIMVKDPARDRFELLVKSSSRAMYDDSKATPKKRKS